jgi:hypothetical protein
MSINLTLNQALKVILVELNKSTILPN